MGPKVSSRRPSTRKQVLLVEDYPVTRLGLRELINREPGLEVHGEAGTVADAKALLERFEYHFAVIDLYLTESFGLDLINDIHDRYPTMVVLAISHIDDMNHIERALHAGARGFYHKTASNEEFLQATRTVLAGELYLSDVFKQQLLAHAADPARQAIPCPGQELSEREMEVFELTGDGYTAEEVALRLHLDAHTVDTYRTRICHKLGLKNSTQLIARAGQWMSATVRRSKHLPCRLCTGRSPK